MKQIYECVFPCQFRGNVIRKGHRVEIDSADLKAAGNEPLSSTASFKLVSSEPPAKSDPSDKSDKGDKAARAELRRKLADLKVPTSEKATIEELTALLAKTTDPLGNDKP